MTHRFNPAHADRLLSEDRVAWNNPEQILGYLNLGPSTVMADIGCGPGWFTLGAARKVQPTGMVYGVDVSQEMLTLLAQRSSEAGLSNVRTILAEEADEYPIPSESVDVMLIANVYHEVDPASNFMGEISRILRPASTCLVVDWRAEETPSGPPLEHRVSQQDVTEEFYASGFVLAGTCDVGPYHYGLTFYKPRRAGEPMDATNNIVP